MKPKSIILNCAIIILIVSPVSSQVQQQGGSSGLTIRIPTDVVMLDAQVLNKKTGRIINGLSIENFILYEEDAQQEVTYFSYDQLPLSIVLLLDVSESVWPGIKQIQAATLQALQQLKPDDEVALMVFAYSSTLVQGFTRDRQVIVDKLASMENFKAYGTQVNDALYQAANYLNKASNPGSRRAIIAITDNESQPISDGEISANETENELLESGATVCGLIVGPFEDNKLGKIIKYYPPILVMDKILSKHKKENFRDYLVPQATVTGGIVLTAKKREIETVFTRMIGGLRTRYSLGYMPLDQNMDGKFRKIQLKVSPEIEKREGGVTILTRQGYYARPRNSDSNAAKESAAPKKID